MPLPEGDGDYSLRISAIKGRFTKIFLKTNISNEYGVRYRRKGERNCMAAAILRAYDQGRRRFPVTCGLYSL